MSPPGAWHPTPAEVAIPMLLAAADASPQLTSLPPPSAHTPAAMRSGWQAAKTSPCRGKKITPFYNLLESLHILLVYVKVWHTASRGTARRPGAGTQSSFPLKLQPYTFPHRIFRCPEVSVTTASADLGEGEVQCCISAPGHCFQAKGFPSAGKVEGAA